MVGRLLLHEELCEFMNSRNVYFRTPGKEIMQYPCIVYDLNSIPTLKADDKNYISFHEYSITLIRREKETDLVDKFMQTFNCRYDRHYVTDGLEHDVFTMRFM